MNAREQTASRPTGTNARQNAEIEALKAQVELLTAMVGNIAPGRATRPILDNDEASKAVLAARSPKPKTYRALMDGTDLAQGFIPAGTIFTTTQPQGSWMELIEDGSGDENAEG
jgi:hypothetical protein